MDGSFHWNPEVNEYTWHHPPQEGQLLQGWDYVSLILGSQDLDSRRTSVYSRHITSQNESMLTRWEVWFSWARLRDFRTQGVPARPPTVLKIKKPVWCVEPFAVSSWLIFIMGQSLQLGAWAPADESMSSFAPLRGLPPSNYRVNDLLNPEPSQYISPHVVHIPWAVYRTFE